MTLRFLLDTNILSEPLKLNPNASVLKKLEQYRTEIATASVVWHELWFGCEKLPDSRKRQTIREYLITVVQPTVPRLPYNSEAAKWHATERVRLMSLGQTPPFVDGQIAAVARVNDLILVTGNSSDFKNFFEIQLENWYDVND